jgi:GT2 family glycosyltransferase
MNPKVSIIILNWNRWEDTIECLEALYQTTYLNYDVIVVDNGSDDRSIENIRKYAEGKIKVKSKFFEYNSSNKPIQILEYARNEIGNKSESHKKFDALPSNKKLTLIKNEKNYGFAEGNNIAIHYVYRNLEAKYIAPLNNDIVVDKSWLQKLVEVAENNSKLGSCASKMLFYDKPNIINAVGDVILKDGSGINRGRGEKDINQYNKLEEVFGACAGAALYKKEMLEDIKLGPFEYFDNDYFAYNEDLDLAYRARLAGWCCLYVPSAIVYHHHSATAKKYSEFKVYQGERNRIWTLIKNYPLKYIILGPIYFTPLKFFLHLLSALRRKGHGIHYVESIGTSKLILTIVKAWLDSMKKWSKMMEKRKIIQKSKKIDNAKIEMWFDNFPTDDSH